MGRNVASVVREEIRGEVGRDVPMAEHTTLRVGGPADALARPEDAEDLNRLVRFLERRGIPRFVLGNGSNLVVRDGGIRGAVMALDRCSCGIELLEREAGGPLLQAGAGVALPRLVRWAAARGISGLEALAGIPGTLGGALTMNAGAWGTEIGDLVVDVEAMDPSGEIRVLRREQVSFGYRRAELPEGLILLAARLRGELGDPEEIRKAIRRYQSRRRARQPTREPSAGSVFRNPPGISAGQLIDQCGLKGVRVGDAEVSRVHANFIVNLGRATAGQVVELMERVQERVYARHRVALEPEVRVIGEWEPGKSRMSQ